MVRRIIVWLMIIWIGPDEIAACGEPALKIRMVLGCSRVY